FGQKGRFEIFAEYADLAGNRDHPAGAWIMGLVVGVAIAGDCLLEASQAPDFVFDVGPCITFAFETGLEEDASIFGCTKDDRTTSEQTGSNGALHSFGSCCIGNPAHLDAGHQAMFGDGNKRSIEGSPLAFRRQSARYEKPGVLGEGERSDEVFAEILAS